MRIFTKTKPPISLIVALIFFASPLLAQQKRNAGPRKPAAATPAPEPALTFDSLLAADSYKIYSEVRNVGQLIRSTALNDVLEPVIKLARPPKEFKTVLKWLNVHADALAGSRLLVAGWPSRPKLPTYLLAIEFSSPEEAKKFEPELRSFMPTLMPTPTPASSPGAGLSTQTTSAAKKAEKDTQDETTLPPYQIKQSGSLVLISDIAFKARDLRPRGSKPLEEDQNFALARNRFASESLFLFVDLKSIEKEEKERRQKWEEEEQKRIESEAANPTKVEDVSNEVDSSINVPPDAPSPVEPPPPQPDPSVSAQVTLGATSGPQAVSSTSVLTSPNPTATAESEAMSGSFISLYSAFFGGQSKWPEAIGAAIAFEGDAYIVRTLIVNDAENKPNAIPFVPQFVSGPALVSEAASVFPADVDFFATASLDYPQIYDGMVKAMASAEELSRRYRKQSITNSTPALSPFAVYEKKLGLKIKEDLLPLLGNELAFALPGKPPGESSSSNPDMPSTDGVAPKTQRAGETNPIVAVAIKDKEAAKRLMPKLIESLAFKGANLFAQTEKHDGAEITSYANMFSYAFIGDFLVISTDPALTRHLVDSYLNDQTLSSDSHYRNSTRWQPRQVLGQVYVAPDLMERYYPSGSGAGAAANDKLREFLARLNPVIEPMTYALSDDGLGPLHELHVPRSLLMLMIAGMSSEASRSPLVTNEAIAKSGLRNIFAAEATYKETKGRGHYGTMEELITENLVAKEMVEKYGYRIEVSVSGNRFEVSAIPVEYGKTGKLSYFVDETGILRGGDHGGGAATIADNQID